MRGNIISRARIWDESLIVTAFHPHLVEVPLSIASRIAHAFHNFCRNVFNLVLHAEPEEGI